jgi:hypothetical protein
MVMNESDNEEIYQIPAKFHNGVASDMSGNTRKRGGILTPEESRAIWLPLIDAQKNCSQCGVTVAEHGPRQASPQQPDPRNLSCSNGNCVALFILSDV